MPQSTAPHDRAFLIQEFVVKYIHSQNFSENNGVPKKRLIRLLRDEFCHDVRDVDSEQKVKREMEHAVRIMVSQMIIVSLEIPGCMVAFRLHPDFNLRGMVMLPESREPSVEAGNIGQPVQETVHSHLRGPKNRPASEPHMSKEPSSPEIKSVIPPTPTLMPEIRDISASHYDPNQASKRDIEQEAGLSNELGEHQENGFEQLKRTQNQFEKSSDMAQQPNIQSEDSQSEPLLSRYFDEDLEQELMLQEKLLQEHIAREEMQYKDIDQGDLHIAHPQKPDAQLEDKETQQVATSLDIQEKFLPPEEKRLDVCSREINVRMISSGERTEDFQPQDISVENEQLEEAKLDRLQSEECPTEVPPMEEVHSETIEARAIVLEKDRTRSEDGVPDEMQLEPLITLPQVEVIRPQETQQEQVSSEFKRPGERSSDIIQQEENPQDKDQPDSVFERDKISHEVEPKKMQIDIEPTIASQDEIIAEAETNVESKPSEEIQIDEQEVEDSHQIGHQLSAVLPAVIDHYQVDPEENQQSKAEEKDGTIQVETSHLEETQRKQIGEQETSEAIPPESPAQEHPEERVNERVELHSNLPEEVPIEGNLEKGKENSTPAVQGQDTPHFAKGLQQVRVERRIESAAQNGTVPTFITAISPRAGRQAVPDTQLDDEQETVAEPPQMIITQASSDQSPRDVAPSLLNFEGDNLPALTLITRQSLVGEQPRQDNISTAQGTSDVQVELVETARSESVANINSERQGNMTSHTSLKEQGADFPNTANSRHKALSNLLVQAKVSSPEELMLVIQEFLESEEMQTVESEAAGPMLNNERTDTPPLLSTVANTLERDSSSGFGCGIRQNLVSERTRRAISEHELELASEACRETESTTEVDIDTRMEDDDVLDSSQPILTPSRKRRRVMEIAPSDQSSYFDHVSPSQSTHSTSQRPTKRMCTPLPESPRPSTSTRLSLRRSETPVIIPSMHPITPSLTLKYERRPDNSEPWLKQAVQVLREQYPDDNLETDNGEILCVDCDKRIKPTRTRNVSGMGNHLRSKGHKDKREKRGERPSLAVSHPPVSNNGYTGYGFDASTSRDQVDAYVRKEDNNAAYYRELAHKAEQDAAKAKIVREQHLLSQFSTLEDSSQGRFNKIESSLEALRSDQREQEASTSTKFTSLEDAYRDQMVELTDKMGFTESQLTESQELIQQANEHIAGIDAKTASKLDSMLNTIARSDHRNIEQIEQQTSEHVKLVQHVNKQNQKWRSRLDVASAKIETLQTLIEDRDDMIQALRSQGDVYHKNVEQMNDNMRIFQERIEAKMEAQGRENDRRVASMKREYTTRTEEMLEKFSDRVQDDEKLHSARIQDLEKQHHSRIKKLERKIAEQAKQIDRHEAMFPVILADAGDLRAYCVEMNQALTAAEEPPQSPKKKQRRSRMASTAP